jgi:hypothetical protein
MYVECFIETSLFIVFSCYLGRTNLFLPTFRNPHLAGKKSKDGDLEPQSFIEGKVTFHLQQQTYQQEMRVFSNLFQI